jgi:hypothetical protein
MTTPPPGPGRVDSGYPGPFGPAGSEDRTRPVQVGAHQAGAHQPGPVPTQYLPPEHQPQPAWPQPGGYPQPGPYGQQPGGWPQPGGPGSPYPPFQPPPPSGGGNRTGLVVGLVVLVLVLVGGASGWYFLLGPGAKKEPAANPSAASGPAAPSAAPSGGAAPAPGADKGGDVAVDVEVGDCVTLSGSDSNADAEPATCGSDVANYKVIGKAPTQSECAGDADATYFESLGGTQVGALCLDVDWVKGDCYDVSGLDPVRVSCTGAGGSKRVRVGETIKGTTSVSRCPDNGYQYDERKFVVCLSTV